MGTTKNATLNTTAWQDVETLTEVTFTDGDFYTITIKGGHGGEVCVAESTPANTFYGHPLNTNENFSYKHEEGNKVFVKGTIIGATLIVT